MSSLAGEVRLRTMTAQDIPAIIAIDQRLSGKQRAATWPQRVGRYLEMYYPPLCFVAEVQGKVVGFILGDVRGWEYAQPPSGWVDIMGVDPAYQKQGVGRGLIAAFVQECRQRQMKAHIMVRQGDRNIQRFMRSAGFKRGQLVDFETGSD